MNFFKGRSDMAAEIAEPYISDENSGIRKTEFYDRGTEITRIDVLTDAAAEALGKEKGRYVTVELKNAFEDDKVFENAIEVLCREIENILAKTVGKKEFSAMLVGLGNSELTSDSVGPDVVKRIVVTSHIRENLPDLFNSMNFNSVSAVLPGVLGKTGIETSVIVGAVTEKVTPDAVILIDALAAHDPDRLCRTVQISDTGISPGSGVGNCRAELSRKTIGVPVITIGIPTVIDTVTLTGNMISRLVSVLEKSTDGEEISVFEHLSSVWNERTSAVLKNRIGEAGLDFIVTPKDIDCLVKKASRLVSVALNKALHNDISQEDILAILG